MIRFLFRFAAVLALVVALILAVLDASRSVLASSPMLTPLGESIAVLSPTGPARWQAAVEAASPVLWNAVAEPVLSLPGFLVFGALALALQLIGRPRRGPQRRFVPGA